MEALYRTSETALRLEASRVYRRWRHGQFKQAQDAYDATDRPKVWSKVGCTLDLIVTDAH